MRRTGLILEKMPEKMPEKILAKILEKILAKIPADVLVGQVWANLLVEWLPLDHENGPSADTNRSRPVADKRPAAGPGAIAGAGGARNPTPHYGCRLLHSLPLRPSLRSSLPLRRLTPCRRHGRSLAGRSAGRKQVHQLVLPVPLHRRPVSHRDEEGRSVPSPIDQCQQSPWRCVAVPCRVPSPFYSPPRLRAAAQGCV